MSTETPAYSRILLKLSGEALMGRASHGIEPEVIRHFAEQIKAVADSGVQVGLVIGGGNIFRGAGLAEAGMDRVSGDQMGMLATVMNALAMQATLDQLGVEARVMSAMAIGTFCEPFSRNEAVRHLQAGRVVIFSGGTGNPFFTTDSAASLRAIEIGADVMIKATKVDGVYSADPVKVPDAIKYDTITYDEALQQKLNVMDATAIVLCRDHNMPLRVFNINESGALSRLLQGDAIGTLVERGEAE